MIIRQPTGDQVADILAIQHLAVSYAEAIGRGEIEEACEVYAPEGVLASPTTPDAIGPAAIAATIRKSTATLEFIFQTVHQGLVQVDGDRASARFPITEWGRRKSDGRGMQFLGLYIDEVVRLDVGWRFHRRSLVPRILGRPDGLTGALHPLDYTG